MRVPRDDLAGCEIGWYVHHQGAGHLARATVLATAAARSLGAAVTGLSSGARPRGWPGGWIEIPRDDDGVVPEADHDDVDAGGRLHWAPRHHAGLAARGSAMSRYFAEARPRLMVVDVSAEAALLARLHGVPVLSVVVPGSREDAAHELAFDISTTLVGFWPEGATSSLLRASAKTMARVAALGGLSRYDGLAAADGPGSRSSERRRRVVLLARRGGDDWSPALVERMRRDAPDWAWTVLGPASIGGRWHPEPADLLREADVVVTHAGQNAIAEVAALRRPAVVLPARRPHAEQMLTAAALGDLGLPAVVTAPDGRSFSDALERAAALDGRAWRHWNDGRAAHRFVQTLRQTITGTALTAPGAA